MLIDALTRTSNTLNVVSSCMDNLLKVKIVNKQRDIEAIGLVAKPISIKATADWQPLKLSGVLADLFNGADMYTKLLHGMTIQQPWMYRKMWTGSKPVNMTVSLLFTTSYQTLNKPHQSIIKDTQNLLGLVYPRRESNNNWIFRTPGPALTKGAAAVLNRWQKGIKFTDTLDDPTSVEIFSGEEPKIGGNAVTKALDKISSFINGASSGKVWASFKSVYPENMQIAYSLQVDSETGEPLYAAVDFNFSCADVICAEVDGSFRLVNLPDMNTAIESFGYTEPSDDYINEDLARGMM